MKVLLWSIIIASLVACGGSSESTSGAEATQTESETEGGETEAPEGTLTSDDPDTIAREAFTEQVGKLLAPQVCDSEEHPVRKCFGASAEECKTKFSAATRACGSILPERINKAQAQEAAFALGQCAGAKYGEGMDAENRRKDLPECKQTREGFLTEVKKVLPPQVCAESEQPPRACFDVTEEECVTAFSASLDACADQVPETFVPEQNQKQLQVLGQCAANKYKETLEPKKRPCGPAQGPVRSAPGL